jgi:dienelactone hydrolase
MNLHFLAGLALLVPAQTAPVAPAVATEAPVKMSPAEVKAAFLKLLDRPKVPLDVVMEEMHAEDQLVTERLSFAAEKKADGAIERVPVLVVRPASPPDVPPQRRPALIVLHGTGGTKDKMRPWLVDLARRGMIGLAIDARYHGSRKGNTEGTTAYNDAITRAWRAQPSAGMPQEHPFYYDTCWDLWRTLDYMASRRDVDLKRIAMLGTSMGGIETWLAGAVDDRVAAAVPAIGVQSFRWSLENEKWQGRAKTIGPAHQAAAADLGEPAVNARVCRALWNKVIPGILGPFDCPSMIRLFAGRPLLVLNGELDPNCPLGGAELAFAAARDAFAQAGASDRLEINVAKGVGHTVTAEQRTLALDWLARWLKP